jgi:hypothetical protein
MSDTQEEKDHLTLKWGTLKSWNFTSEKGKKLLERYFEIGSSMSAICQHDTQEQKQIVLDLIDECASPIYNDWEGAYFPTKQDAKDYVTNYGKSDA